MLDIKVDNSQIIDIRLPSEWYESGIIADCKLITYEMISGKINPLFIDEVRKHFNKDDEIVLICHTGVRSRAAMELLKAYGFKHVSDIGGGIYNYERLGGKLVKYEG